MRFALISILLAACGTTDDMMQPDANTGTTVEAKFSSLYGDYLAKCKNCHTPTAPGHTSDIEKTLDFTSQSTAYTSVKGMASGLTGNFMDCNGTPFIATAPKDSLLLAVLDQSTRNAFDVAAHAGCDMDTIGDETVKVGSQPSAAFITALKDWITAGAPNN